MMSQRKCSLDFPLNNRYRGNYSLFDIASVVCSTAVLMWI